MVGGDCDGVTVNISWLIRTGINYNQAKPEMNTKLIKTVAITERNIKLSIDYPNRLHPQSLCSKPLPYHSLTQPQRRKGKVSRNIHTYSSEKYGAPITHKFS